ncbi:MAG: hypoxanthine phosphoribosyltransferase [Bacteriovoracaceae bacterium]|nr:hypoxanthine phosphoribosyltransferase [Bacteriovoracaceae bacterium]
MELYTPEALISEEEIALRIAALGAAITKDFEDEEIVVICVLKGAFMFCSDLIKKINRPLSLDFISLSSYGDSTHSSGNVKLDMDITANIEGKNVVIVEDIVDSGLTIKTLMEILSVRKPKTIKLASLLFKPTKLQHKVTIDYLGFEIEDKFVIGYGLDYAGRYRELPYIGILNAGN